MLGAIIGDIVGSPYEGWNVYKRSKVKPFEKARAFQADYRFTDDTVLSMAVARACLDKLDVDDMDIMERYISEKLKKYYKKYPLNVGGHSLYGGGFAKWAETEGTERRPGNPKTNGAAMRVAPVGWIYDSLKKTMDVAKASAIGSHNSKEAIQGAQMIAVSIYLARNGAGKEGIQDGLKELFGPGASISTDLKRVEIIRKENQEYRKAKILKREFNQFIFCESERTVDHALYSFFLSKDFKDCIRTAVSLGGDSDTIACMAGAVAEAYYGVPEDWEEKTYQVLGKYGCRKDDLEMILNFEKNYVRKEKTGWRKEIDKIVRA